RPICTRSSCSRRASLRRRPSRGRRCEKPPFVTPLAAGTSPRRTRSLFNGAIGGGRNGTRNIVVAAGRADPGDHSAVAILRPLIIDKPCNESSADGGAFCMRASPQSRLARAAKFRYHPRQSMIRTRRAALAQSVNRFSEKTMLKQKRALREDNMPDTKLTIWGRANSVNVQKVL